MVKRGHFIVIEGTDGSGKRTQIDPLSVYLASKKIAHEIIDFPRYEDNIYGKLVGEYLKGSFGGLEIHPKLASLPYMMDRLLAKPLIEKWLSEGKLVIANRYATSNQAFMTAKMPTKDRKPFLKWLQEAEYDVNQLPQEDLVILLNVTGKVAQQNVDKKAARGYMGGKARDIHEDNLDYQNEVAKVYLSLAKNDPKWEVIKCIQKGQLRPIDSIQEEILTILKQRKIIT